MRKIASILLLGILLFNWIGFRLYSSYMEQKANSNLEAQLDNNNFNEADLVSIKVPAGHLSSYTLSTKFERVDGQVEVNGIQYKYVQRRMFNDSLEYLCMPNQQVMKMQTAREDFFKLVNDLQQQTGQSKKANSHSGSSKNFSTDNYTVHEAFVMNHFYKLVSQKTFFYAEALSSAYSFTAGQPPEHC